MTGRGLAAGRGPPCASPRHSAGAPHPVIPLERLTSSFRWSASDEESKPLARTPPHRAMNRPTTEGFDSSRGSE